MNDKMILSERIVALEKATAKKPYTKEGYSYYCPRCNHSITAFISASIYLPYYCENCGQKLDWGNKK